MEKKPLVSGQPAMASVDATKVQYVMGMCLRRPPMKRMSCARASSWMRACMAWMTLPAPRKRQALKNAWVKTWKKPAANAPDADAQEHEAELAHGAVGEHLLDVVLHEGDGRGEERGRRADDGDEHHREGGQDEDEREAAHEVDARRDHRRRVDERADRRRARHRVGEPDVERDLRALARAAEEQGQADGGRRADGDGVVRLQERRGDPTYCPPPTGQM